jgi:hypothetical protein
MRRPLVYCSISKMSTRMGRYRQITCTGPISRMSESMTSSIEVNTASMTVGSTSIAPRSDAGCLGKGRVGRSSHYSDARRSVDSHCSTLGLLSTRALRSLQRRKIIEERIASEEGYIADLTILKTYVIGISTHSRH